MKHENKNYVIVRGDRSGVFFGELKERSGQEVELRNARKLWYWDGAAGFHFFNTREEAKNDKY